MFKHEKGQQNPTEFPLRFLPFMKKEEGNIKNQFSPGDSRDLRSSFSCSVFAKGVDACFAISQAEVGVLADIYPEVSR